MLARAAGAADAMHVVFVGIRNIVVDHMRDFRDVEAAGSDVGRHEDIDLILLEAGKRALAMILRFIAVDRRGFKSSLLERLGELLHAMLGAAEDDDLVEFGLDQKIVQDVELRFGTDAHDILIYRLRGVARFDRHRNRLAQKFTDQFLDLTRERRREEKRMAIGGNARENRAHVAYESHVEHAISLVQYDRIKCGEIQNAALYQILEAPRSADDEVGAAAQGCDLSVDIGSANARHGADSHVFCKTPVLFFDLLRELARRRHDKDTLIAILQYFIDERNEKGARLARAGIRDTDDIAALEKRLDRGVLHGRRCVVSLLRDIGFELRVEREIGKTMLRREGRLVGSNGIFIHEAGDIDILLPRCSARAPLRTTLRATSITKSTASAGAARAACTIK